MLSQNETALNKLEELLVLDPTISKAAKAHIVNVYKVAQSSYSDSAAIRLLQDEDE